VPYIEQTVEGGLQRWVECVWSIETADPLLAYPVRPDGCIDILYSAAGNLEVVGAMTAERRFDLAPQARTAGIRFRPGMAAQFLRIPAEELTDRIQPLEDPILADRLANARSGEECRRILASILRPPADPPNGVQRAIEAVASSHGDINLEWIARQAGMSGRQFRRRCLEESGLSPKHLCRVLRFRRACTLGERGGLPWGLIAAEAGYFDQAHLIRDFREFTGNTPVSVFSNTGDGHSG
jgi:AraC-like DNA-binding protein